MSKTSGLKLYLKLQITFLEYRATVVRRHARNQDDGNLPMEAWLHNPGRYQISDAEPDIEPPRTRYAEICSVWLCHPF
jgi:hypothetical protein